MRLAAPDPAVIAETTLFKGLPAGEFSQLVAFMHEKSFPTGASVPTAEDPGATIYVILSGSAKVHLEQSDGTEMIADTLDARAFLALGSEDHGRALALGEEFLVLGRKRGHLRTVGIVLTISG